MRRRIIFSVLEFCALYVIISVLASSLWPDMPPFLFFLSAFVLPLVVVLAVRDIKDRRVAITENVVAVKEAVADAVRTPKQKQEVDLNERERKISEKESELAEREATIEENYSVKVREVTAQLDSVKSQLQALRAERCANEHALRDIQQYRIALEKTEQRVLSWVKLREAEEMEYFNDIRADVERFEKYAELTPDMDGFKFEEHVAKVLADNGYTEVTVTQKSRDFGADIAAVFGGARYVFQCKYYTSPVGIDAVQEVYASKPVYSAHVAVVVTNSVFTKAAKILADEVGVILWDGEKLAAMNVQEKTE